MTMKIALVHRYYDPANLEEVKQIMQKRGAPTIQGVYSEKHKAWLAFEGCHRLRAAKQLGVKPFLLDVSKGVYETITVQMSSVIDGKKHWTPQAVNVRGFARWLENTFEYREVIEFDGE